MCISLLGLTTKKHRLSGLKGNLFSHSLRARKSKIKAQAELRSSEAPLPGPQMAVPLGRAPGVPPCALNSSYKDTSQIGLEPMLALF